MLFSLMEIAEQQNSFWEINLKHAVRNNLFLNAFPYTKVTVPLLFQERENPLLLIFILLYIFLPLNRLVLNSKEYTRLVIFVF